MTEKQIAGQQKASADASPAKSLITDLVKLRRTVRLTARSYAQRLEAEIDQITAWASERAKDRAPNKSNIRNLGDMLTLVRQLEVKSEKGRRKDLRALDETLRDLRSFVGKKPKASK